LLLLYFAVYYIIIIFYPRQSLFSAHTHTTHNNTQIPQLKRVLHDHDSTQLGLICHH